MRASSGTTKRWRDGAVTPRQRLCSPESEPNSQNRSGGEEPAV